MLKHRGPRFVLGITTLALGLVALAPAGALGAKPAAPEYVFQDVELAPFERSHTFVLKGKATPEGCVYSNPDVTLPADAPAWQVRDLGVDMKSCTKLVEEGIPTEPSPDEAGTTVTAAIGGSDAAGSVVAASVAAGHAHAWYEEVAGLTVSSDTTFISFAYSGGCVTSGSASVQWTFATGTGWHIVPGTNGGTSNRTCARFFADSWAAIETSSFPLCPLTRIRTTFSHVRAYGWPDGRVTGSRVDSETRSNLLCPFPLFEHFEVKKTG